MNKDLKEFIMNDLRNYSKNNKLTISNAIVKKYCIYNNINEEDDIDISEEINIVLNEVLEDVWKNFASDEYNKSQQ